MKRASRRPEELSQSAVKCIVPLFLRGVLRSDRSAIVQARAWDPSKSPPGLGRFPPPFVLVQLCTHVRPTVSGALLH